MDKVGFRKYLKTRGKKDHVIEALVLCVEKFEAYLLQRGVNDLERARPEDVYDLAEWLEGTKKGSAKKVVRGLVLYFDMTGDQPMRAAASEIREAAIALSRKAFSLREFRGVDEQYVDKLEAEGIRTTDQIIEACKTPTNRSGLSQKTGIPLEVILEYVKLSDLSRLEGLKGVRARLYYDAGVDTIDKLARWDPDELRQLFLDYVEQVKFDGIAPLPKEIRSTIAKAKQVEHLVEYD